MHVNEADLIHSLFNFIKQGFLSLARLHQDISICLVKLKSQRFKLSRNFPLHEDRHLNFVEIVGQNLIKILLDQGVQMVNLLIFTP